MVAGGDQGHRFTALQHFEAGRSPIPNTPILQKRSPRLRVTSLTLKGKKKKEKKVYYLGS